MLAYFTGDRICLVPYPKGERERESIYINFFTGWFGAEHGFGPLNDTLMQDVA